MRAGTALPTSPAGVCSREPSPTTLAVVGIYPTQGFETAIAAPTTAPYVRVQALSADGSLLRSSRVVQS